MKISSAQFLCSNTELSKCPEPDFPEYAFIGRSNVGKSSLINMITDNFKLAKTSGKPGKTQTINHFLINASWYLVDLPGYGYAKTSKENRSLWQGFIKEYITQRQNLMCVLVLIDSRLEPQKNDLLFMENLGLNGIPFVMVFTKIDKLSASQLNKNVVKYKKQMLEKWESLPQSFITSAENKNGKDELLNFIDSTNKLFKK